MEKGEGKRQANGKQKRSGGQILIVEDERIQIKFIFIIFFLTWKSKFLAQFNKKWFHQTKDKRAFQTKSMFRNFY